MNDQRLEVIDVRLERLAAISERTIDSGSEIGAIASLAHLSSLISPFARQYSSRSIPKRYTSLLPPGSLLLPLPFGLLNK